MIHVQHLLGIGHVQRALSLAAALTEKGFAVVVASGGMPGSITPPQDVELFQLPPVRSPDGRFDTFLDERDLPIDDSWRASRRDQLLDLFHRLEPRILITETYPFGRRMLRFELVPLLEAAKAHPACKLIVSSIRDVLQPKHKPGREAEIIDLVENFYDRVIVHGDVRICRLEDSFAAASRISDKVSYSGYITRSSPSPTRLDSTEVLVSAGGSDRGLAILRSALAARPLSCLAEHPWRILLSHAFDEARFAEIDQLATEGIVVERNRTDFPALLGNARLSISQAGYNTMTDLLASKTPAVVVPYAEADELEQTIRADRLQQLGRVVVVRDADLSAETLATAIDQAARLEAELDVSLDGARNSAELISGWLATNGKIIA